MLRIVGGCDHDDIRGEGALSQLGDKSGAVHQRHVDVDNGEIDRLLFDDAQRVVPVAAVRRDVQLSVALDVVPVDGGDHWIILDDENLVHDDLLYCGWPGSVTVMEEPISTSLSTAMRPSYS